MLGRQCRTCSAIWIRQDKPSFFERFVRFGASLDVESARHHDFTFAVGDRDFENSRVSAEASVLQLLRHLRTSCTIGDSFDTRQFGRGIDVRDARVRRICRNWFENSFCRSVSAVACIRRRSATDGRLRQRQTCHEASCDKREENEAVFHRRILLVRFAKSFRKGST